jgi:hypothetical protein
MGQPLRKFKQTLAKDHTNLKKHVRVRLWTKPAGNVHLPAIPLFLRVGMLSWIQHVFLNRKSVASTGSSIHPKNQHPQQKSEKYHQAPRNMQRYVSGFLWVFIGFSQLRFQQEGPQIPQQDSPLSHPKN